MKRALAERAKQSLSSPTTSASPPNTRTVPPSKLRRVATGSDGEPGTVPVESIASATPTVSSHDPAPDATVSSVPTALSASASPTPTTTVSSTTTLRKPPRPELTVPDDASAFYLRHQNRALAVEWRLLQHQIQRLEGERHYRRKQTQLAVTVLRRLQQQWREQPQQQQEEVTATTVPSCGTTGTGDSVEWAGTLLQTLTELGGDEGLVMPRLADPVDQDEQDQETDQETVEWTRQCARNIAARAARLGATPTTVPDEAHGVALDTMAEPPSYREDLESRIHTLQCQLAECSAARTDAVASERKLRRNFYKLQAGLLTKEQFWSDMHWDPDDDLPVMVEAATPTVPREGAAASAVPNEPDGTDGSGQAGDIRTSGAEIQALREQVKDLEEKVANRDESISNLSQQAVQREKRINELSARQQSDEDRHRLSELQKSALQLEATRAEVSATQLKLAETRQKWALAFGNEQLMQQTMEDQQQKFNKKWEELSVALAEKPVEGDGLCASAPRQDATEEAPLALLQAHTEQQARQISELQHKLTQALENVRQAETTRDDLKSAFALNEFLQSKLDDLKGKLAAVKSGATNKTDHQSSTEEAVSNVQTISLATRDAGGSTGSIPSEKLEKLHRENRRMRKDMSNVLASKEAAKAKLERVEKERDSLIEMNARLLRQMAEKDEMNAKSLSTILHLKSMTDKLEAERDNLEQQTKSASQLALAARLAANAKERVTEEAQKEQEALQEECRVVEERLHAAKAALERVSSEWSVASSTMASAKTELSRALKRGDELAEEIERKNAEIRRLMDLVRKAERKASEALGKMHVVNEPNGDNTISGFSVEQLNTQVAVLKSKLACPVCHYRDKECIIMRCRHLHCKHCVEERITSRNRKCPTCNNKFTEKDVADIWLNT